MPAEFHYFPFDDGPGEDSLEDRWEAMMQFMRTTGVIIDWGQMGLDPSVDDLAVTAGGGLDVQVAVGEAWIHGFMFQQQDDYYLIDISPNASGLDRIDLLTARLDTDANTIEYHVEEGTPAMSPVAPTPVETAPIWDLSLASIYVADGAVTILPGDITDLRVISTQDTSASAVTLSSAGAGESLVADGTGPLLETKSLTAGMNITLTPSAGDITIDAADLTTTLTSAGGTETLVDDGTGPDLAIKGLTAGTNITLTDGGGYVLIDAADAAAVTLSNAGTTSLVNDGTGPALATKGLVAGSNISFSTTAADVTINASNSPSDSPVCILSLSMDQTVSDGMADDISWDTEVMDSDNMWDAMDPTEILIPEDGLYEIKVNVAWTGSVSSNGTVSAYAVLNGMDTITQSNCLAVGNVSVSNNTSALVDLSAMDVITVVAENNSGVSLNVDSAVNYFPYVSVIKVRS